MRTQTMTGGQALVDALVAHGVDLVFGIPGTHNLEIYKHLAERGVRHVGTRHEQGAGYAADGYARTTGKVGVAVVTTGPALMNAAAAVGQAYSDSVPILVISPGMPVRHPALGNGLLHESRSQTTVMNALAAASLRATSVAEIPTTVAQAFAIMTAGRPRPVHLEVPLDVLLESAEVWPVAALPSVRPSPSEAAIEAACGRIEASDRVCMVVGGGARGASEQVRLLAERLQAPVVTTTNGKGVLAEDHPCALGAGVHLTAVRDLVAASDLVIGIGTEFAPSDYWYGALPLADKLVRVDIDPVGALTNVSGAVTVVGDAGEVLDRILAGATAKTQGHDVAVWREQKQKEASAGGAIYADLIAELAAALPRDVVLATDNAMACYYGAMPNLPMFTPSYLFPTGFGTLGYGLPAAIGAKLGEPERPVVAMLGDGGVMFTVQELATAVQERLTLPVVIVDNSGYGEIRDEMADRADPVHAVTFAAPDFALLGKALGCHGVTLDGPSGLGDALRAAQAVDLPTVIHVRLSEGVS